MNAVTPILSFLLALASPASDEAVRLVDEGRDSEAFALAERGASEGDADRLCSEVQQRNASCFVVVP